MNITGYALSYDVANIANIGYIFNDVWMVREVAIVAIGWLWMNFWPRVFFVGLPKQTKICWGKKKTNHGMNFQKNPSIKIL